MLERCWRRPPEWEARQRSVATLFSPDGKLDRAEATERAENTNCALHFLLYSSDVHNRMRSAFPATPAHAASCPPFARERYMRSVARMSLGHAVTAARFRPLHQAFFFLQLTKLGI